MTGGVATERVTCPCCGLATLAERGGYDICRVCWWEDDGQGERDADKPNDGPNGRYSLTRARANVRAHGHMYDRGAGIAVVERPSPERARLVGHAMELIERGVASDETFARLLREQITADVAVSMGEDG